MEWFYHVRPCHGISDERWICVRAWHIFGASEHREGTLVSAQKIGAPIGGSHLVGERVNLWVYLLARLEGELWSENANLGLNFVSDFTTRRRFALYLLEDCACRNDGKILGWEDDSLEVIGSHDLNLDDVFDVWHKHENLSVCLESTDISVLFGVVCRDGKICINLC